MTPARPVLVFADSAATVSLENVDEAHGLAAALDGAGLPGVEDVVVGFRSVTVVTDPTATDMAAVRQAMATMSSRAGARPGAARIEIPVAFDGPDLVDVARAVALSPDGVVDLLTGDDLQVAFVGFAPGFAYLTGLPAALAVVPRRSTPRPSVAAGSVALGGGFAGVYPQASPGGWHLVGRTSLRLFDATSPPYGRLRPGDSVRFVPADAVAAPLGPSGRPRATGGPPDGPTVTVENAGLLSFVQDAGRSGVAALGVPRAGAADPYALRMANRLVGNDESAAAVELTGRGPSLRFSAATHAAVVGTADVTVDGRRVPGHAVVPVDAGQTMTVGVERHSLRGYIAVAGGIDIAPVLGSRSSDVLCGLGLGPLQSGDVLGLGIPGRPRGQARPSGGSPGGAMLRVVPGPDPFPPAVVAELLARPWLVDATSDRIGVRLGTDRVLDVPGADGASRGMVTGAIQLPPDGRPIVLLCDHATVGGYPVIATVISADLGLVGQLRPGDTVGFESVDLAGAVEARSARERELAAAVVGWYPVRTD